MRVGGNLNRVVQATSIVGGVGHTCVGGPVAVWCWGTNSNGQLGNGSVKPSAVPVVVKTITEGGKLAAGNFHSCAISQGAAYCWGKNDLGQLGDGTLTDSTEPKAVLELSSSVTNLSAAGDATCAVVDSRIRCWGAGVSSPVLVATSGTVTDVSVGHSHKCAIIDERAYCWGSNALGQLGDGTTTDRGTPTLISSLPSPVQKLALGYSHSCAVAAGAAYCWGGNSGGQLGNGTTVSSSSPVGVTGLSSGVTDLASGGRGVAATGGSILGSHTCAVVGGAVKCWGTNANGQLGNDSREASSAPVTVDGLSGVTSVGGGGSASLGAHTCSISSGEYYCWGWNAFSQLGDGSSAESGTPVRVDFIE